jgi:hypothetical protein
VTCLRSRSSALFVMRIFSARCFGVYDSGDVNFAVGGYEEVSGCPQPPQNFSSGSFEKPQDEHVSASEAPHSEQKRRPWRFSWWHRGHRIPTSRRAEPGWVRQVARG